jgi:phosphoribosylglycinamide formyltransferase-1
MSIPKLAILVSGSGTNMENLIRESQAGRIPAETALVVCDNPAAAAIQKAERLRVPAVLIDRKKFLSKEAFEAEIIKALENARVDWIILAGFMRILSQPFVAKYKGRIINIHPSLLPKFPGAHGIRDAFHAKEKETGVTVHFVDEGVDTGPVILQQALPIKPEDSLETLESKVHELEYKMYPEALRRVLSGKVKF